MGGSNSRDDVRDAIAIHPDETFFAYFREFFKIEFFDMQGNHLRTGKRQYCNSFKFF